jgi:hypothetical protein
MRALWFCCAIVVLFTFYCMSVPCNRHALLDQRASSAAQSTATESAIVEISQKLGGLDPESSTGWPASRPRPPESSSAHPGDVLREGMTEPEVAAALQVTHVERRLSGISTVSFGYICLGSRFPLEFIDCNFVWSREGNSGDLVAVLTHWSRIDDWKCRLTELALVVLDEFRRVEPDYAIRSAFDLNTALRASAFEDDSN